MEFYGDPTCCDMAAQPAPVAVPEPAPLPAFEPPAYVAPAPEISFPEAPPAPVAVPAAPVAVEAPAPASYQPVAEATLSSGTLLGPSTVGGSTDLGGGWIGGAPDLSGSGVVGGSPSLSGSGFVGGTPDLGGSIVGGASPDLGGSWVDSNGTPVAAPSMPLAPGPFSAAAAGIVNANNSAIVDGWLGGGSSSAYPAYWTPGYDFDRDGVLNESDRDPRNRFS